MTEEQARQIISPLGGGGTGDGFLPSYIVGETPYASDWLSDEVSGEPIEPEEGLLYLILTHGDYYSGFYRYLESESSYVLVGNARIRELTKAEYFALTEDEKNDGTVYFITDDGGPQPIDLPDRGFTPVGTIIAVMGNTVPKYYLACDGATYNIVTYPELAAYFADQFGSANYFGGDGTTTFAVPDLRGEFLRGTGTNSHTNQGDGANVGTHQDATKHVDAMSGPNSALNYIGIKRQFSGDTTYALNTDWSDTGKASNLFIKNATIDADSSRAYYTSRPTNTSVLYCIAVKDIYVYSIDVSAKGGHEIKDNGVAVTDRDVLNFTDFDISDDSTNEETDIKAHRLTSAEMSEIMSTLPGTPTELPVLFDETGAEHVVGWYKLANGTKKPVYQKMLPFTTPTVYSEETAVSATVSNSLVQNIDQVVSLDGFYYNENYTNVLNVTSVVGNSYGVLGAFQLYYDKSLGVVVSSTKPEHSGRSGYVIYRYTKSTDTPV